MPIGKKIQNSKIQNYRPNTKGIQPKVMMRTGGVSFGRKVTKAYKKPSRTEQCLLDQYQLTSVIGPHPICTALAAKYTNACASLILEKKLNAFFPFDQKGVVCE